MNRSTLVVGSAESSGLQLQGAEIAPEHATIIRHSHGLVLQDGGSALGTFVNGDRVDRVQLSHGDILRVGEYRFNVDMEDEANDEKMTKVTARIELPNPPATGPFRDGRPMIAVRAEAKENCETARLDAVTTASTPGLRASRRRVAKPVPEPDEAYSRGMSTGLIVGIILSLLVVTGLMALMLSLS